MLPEYREVILDKLEHTAGMKGIRDAIVYEASLTPEGIHNRYRVLNGSDLWAGQPRQIPGCVQTGQSPKRSAQVLYLAGGAAHPGPGMPMVLMSGWIAADSLDQDVRGGKLVRKTAVAH